MVGDTGGTYGYYMTYLGVLDDPMSYAGLMSHAGLECALWWSKQYLAMSQCNIYDKWYWYNSYTGNDISEYQMDQNSL